nr:hypothetical protein [Tanacetum cinerariifolium]
MLNDLKGMKPGNRESGEKQLQVLAGEVVNSVSVQTWGRKDGVWDIYIVGPCGLLRTNKSFPLQLWAIGIKDNSPPRPPKEFVSTNSDTKTKSFSPSPIPVEDSDSLIEEIDLSFNPVFPMSSGIEDDNYDSERDILIFEYLPSNDTLLIPKIESFHFDIPLFSRPPAKPPDGNTRILNVKIMGDISDQKAHMYKLMITLVLNQEKSPDLLSHRGLKTFQPSAKCPMMIHGKNIPILDVPLFYFYPLDQFKYRGIWLS